MNDLFSDFFRTSRFVPLTTDLSVVGVETLEHFKFGGYEVSGSRTGGGGWHISVQKGEWFRMILGLKTALNISIEPTVGGVQVTAGVGIFEQQIIPTLLTVFVFTPIVFAQIWGIIQQNKLDEEAVSFIEDRIRAHSGGPSPYRPAPSPRTADDAARAAAERELGEPGY